jgi:hypothetical protein
MMKGLGRGQALVLREYRSAEVRNLTWGTILALVLRLALVRGPQVTPKDQLRSITDH